MAVDVIMPQMGESIFEGTITRWLKKPGDHVERDEPLFEISTDKVDAEIPAPSAGVLKEIKVTEGQTVPIQTVVAVIEAAGAAAEARRRSRPPASSGGKGRSAQGGGPCGACSGIHSRSCRSECCAFGSACCTRHARQRPENSQLTPRPQTGQGT